MKELFRKHYSYGETIPILDTQVGTIVDIYEVVGNQQEPPHIKGVFVATAGPMKSLPLIVDPLENESKVVHLANIPVQVPNVRTVDISLIFDISNYRWTPSPDVPAGGGLIGFDLRCRAAFSILGKSYTLLLDQRPCSITLTSSQWTQQPMRVPVGAGTMFAGFGDQSGGQPYQSGDEQQRMMQGTLDGASSGGSTFTNQLDVEERLRQLSTKLLARS
jgi:hypothetical protein